MVRYQSFTLTKHGEFILSPVSLLMVLLYLKELGTVSPAQSLPGGDKSGCRHSWHQPLGNCTYAFGGTKAELLERGKDFLWIPLTEVVSLSKSRMIHFHGSHAAYFNPILRIQQYFLTVS